MEEQPVLTDFPKLHCPFLRQTFKVDVDQWRKHGARRGLRSPEAYLVVDRVTPDYEWVFEDPDTFAVEKLNGTRLTDPAAGVEATGENGRGTLPIQAQSVQVLRPGM